ncbi:hypothetical protein [Palleronia sp. LCG004]|uniref:hypothetical protein n=1 Tax=Palleronia sp. LCG004 TaxID=3079304 RepID=UPI0029431582|nr:hypothetical protein [Palleronia sp. LCG004]WOI57420.1 hypothetical protein RVY76_06445 [Palleronia sp. LCG004]
MRHIALAIGLVIAAPSFAQTPMTAEEFEDYVTGKTLYYASNGIAYGIEEYHPGREVRWSFLDDECKEGVWYPRDEQICFEYIDGNGPQCWTFFLQDGGLMARFADDPPGSELYETQTSDEPLKCPGPAVGV